MIDRRTDTPARDTAAPWPAAPAVPVRRWRLARGLGLGALGLATGVAVLAVAGELSGWRVLAGPAEHWLSRQLGRPVSIARQHGDDFQLQLWRGIRLRSSALRVDGPAWAGATPLFEAEQVELRARWRDLFAWHRGEPLPLTAVLADRLRVQLQRRPDGSANWQRSDGLPQPADAELPRALPVTVGLLSARDGSLHVVDAMTRSDLDVRFSLHEDLPPGAGAAARPASAPPVPASSPAADVAVLAPAPPQGLQASATGSYRGLPLRGELRTGSLRPLLDEQDDAQNLAVVLALAVGRAKLDFNGALKHPLRNRDLLGRIALSGPSLAAVGQPLGITLPTTAPFALQGSLASQGPLWSAVLQQVRIGKSQLDGEFQYDTRHAPVPRLAGRLHARTLALADLGPTIGTRTPDRPVQVRSAGRVLPDHRFDLPSLRAMNANVLVRLDRLDFGTAALQDVAPLNGHLTLTDGVLRLSDLDARLAQGRIGGLVQLDGRGDRALWLAELDGRGLRLEQWISAVKRAGQAPYASGLLGARVRLTGAGRSTAEILGSANGRIGLHWTHGQVSHLVVEAAGLDIAQGLGVLFRGDNPLAVSCGLADLAVQGGGVTPRAFVVDTTDSRLWLTGSMSLADERLSLLARVQPKDFSPLALRAPLHIEGTLGAPTLSLDKQALASRAVPAALLAMLHPLAALIPLFDIGEAGPTQGCAALLADARRQPGGPAPAAASGSR